MEDENVNWNEMGAVYRHESQALREQHHKLHNATVVLHDTLKTLVNDSTPQEIRNAIIDLLEFSK